jgi:hypothetical protein
MRRVVSRCNVLGYDHSLLSKLSRMANWLKDREQFCIPGERLDCNFSQEVGAQSDVRRRPE